MDYSIFDLCDYFVDVVDVFELMFINFGGCLSFSGWVKIVKCFENNELICDILIMDGIDSVFLIDGGGLIWCVLIDIELVEIVFENNW